MDNLAIVYLYSLDMRVIAEIPHHDFRITIFGWNNKYLIKFEKGSYEQTYKVSEMDVAGDEEIKKLLEDKGFVDSVISRFLEMNKSLNAALNRLDGQH